MRLCAGPTGYDTCSPSWVAGQGCPRPFLLELGRRLVWPRWEDASPGCPLLTDMSVEVHPEPLNPCLTQPQGFAAHSSALSRVPCVFWFLLALTLHVGQKLGGLKGPLWG